MWRYKGPGPGLGVLQSKHSQASRCHIITKPKKTHRHTDTQTQTRKFEFLFRRAWDVLFFVFLPGIFFYQVFVSFGFCPPKNLDMGLSGYRLFFRFFTRFSRCFTWFFVTIRLCHKCFIRTETTRVSFVLELWVCSP
jgi:hypothetical protein